MLICSIGYAACAVNKVNRLTTTNTEQKTTKTFAL